MDMLYKNEAWIPDVEDYKKGYSYIFLSFYVSLFEMISKQNWHISSFTAFNPSVAKLNYDFHLKRLPDLFRT